MCQLTCHFGTHRGKKSRPHGRRPGFRPCSTSCTSDLRPARRDREAKTSAPAITIATFNARTLKNQFRVSELARLANDLHLDIVAVQEHRRVLSDNAAVSSLRVGSGWSLWLTSATVSGQGGVGLLLSPLSQKLLLGIKSLHSRVLAATFQMHQNKLHVVNCYMPTASAPTLNATEECIDVISAFLAASSRRDVVCVLGDFNADLKACVKNSHGYHQSSSPHADAVEDFVTSNQLSALNGYMRQRQKRLVTFYGPNQRRARLDYIFIQDRWKRLVKDIRSLRPLCITSDHTMLISKLNMHPWKFKRPLSCRPLLDWNSLRVPATRRRFTGMVVNRCRAGGGGYNVLMESINDAAENVLPRRRKPREQCLWLDDPQIASARQCVLQSDADTRSQHRLALYDRHEQRRQELINEVTQELSRHHSTGHGAGVWRCVNRLSGRRDRPPSTVSANSIPERLSGIRNHFAEIFAAPSHNQVTLPPIPELLLPTSAANTEPVTPQELFSASREIQLGRAAGRDGVPSDVWRLERLSELLLPTINSVVATATPPDEWKIACMVAIPKKSNSTAYTDMRGISLLSSAAKLCNRVILNRLRQMLEVKLLDIQSGFRPCRSTNEQITALRVCIEACTTRKKSLCILFLDFSKAFDTVNRCMLKEILLLYEVPTVLVNAIMSMYTNTEAYVRTPDGETELFSTHTGVLQGDTLAPYLFIVCMDYIMRCSLTDRHAYTVRRRLSSRKLSVKLSALAYADDVAIMSDTAESAQAQLQKFEQVSVKVGLKLNLLKSMVMFVGAEAASVKSSTGATLTVCEDYKYLGSHMIDTKTAVKHRRRLAWAAARRLNNVWDCNIPTCSKVQLFKACVQSVFLYGGESWTLTGSLSAEIDASHRALLRYAMGIRYPQVIESTQLYDVTKCVSASEVLRLGRLRLFGHVTRRPSTPLAVVLHPENQPSEPFRRGGSLKYVYTKQLAEDCRHIQRSIAAAWQEAKDRVAWSALLQQMN